MATAGFTCVSTDLERTVLKVSERVAGLQCRSSWLTRTESSLWYELVSCLLGSRVTFEHAQYAANYLRRTGLLRINRYVHNIGDLEKSIAETLSRPIFPPQTRFGNRRKYIFHRSRANHIARTVQSLYATGSSIKHILKSSYNSLDARQRLMTSTVGIGPKQSSLFLRNVGYAQDLAILDTHVLTYMRLLEIASTSTREISKLETYRKVEEGLLAYASRLNVNLPELDTAIWVVMRIYSKEFSQ